MKWLMGFALVLMSVTIGILAAIIAVFLRVFIEKKQHINKQRNGNY